MTTERPDPSTIMRLATGYWASATLLAANKLGVFGALAAGPRPATAVARELGLAARSTEMLLDACVGLGLLTKEDGTEGSVYRNTPDTEAFLVPGGPGYLSTSIQWAADQYEAWGALAGSVRSDTPAVPPAVHLGDDPEQTRTFVLAMHRRALGVARGVIQFLDFAGSEQLLDVGGGPGTYSVLLAQKYPGLHSTVLDLPAVVTIAEELIREAGFADRVRVKPGNGTVDDYGDADYDAVLFSGVLHQMAPETIRGMFRKAKKALRPGGRIAVSDMMLNADRTQPVFSALFSLQMLLTSAEGAVFSSDECRSWLEAEGFHNVRVQALPPPLPYVIVRAVS